MPKYKFKIEKEKLPDEEINQRKDFKRLKHRYQKATTPLYRFRLDKFKNRRIFIAILLILLLMWLLTMDEENNGEQNKQQDSIELIE